jgi:hypothetical protein
MAVEFHHGRNHPYPAWSHPRLTVDNYVDFGNVLPSPTSRVDWQSKVSNWPMYLNDQIGDCTEACKAHIIQAWSTYGLGAEKTVTNNKVLSWYERDGGYVPGDPSTDNGCVIQDVLANWQQNDASVCPVTEYAELKNFYVTSNLKEALYLFGTVYLGINVPQSAMDQFNAGEPWTYVGDNKIIGGHAIPLQEVYEPGVNDMFTVVTWGQTQRMSQSFVHNYVEEAWVILSPEWFNSSGVDPSGFNLSELQADFSVLA